MGRAVLPAILLAALLAVATGSAKADPVPIDGQSRIPLTSFETFLDPDRALTIADVRGEAATRFVAASPRMRDHSQGFTSDALWLRVELDVAETAAGRYFLTLDVPNFDQLDVWNSWSGAGALSAALGDRIAMAVPNRVNTAVLDLPAGRHTLWMRAVTTGAMVLPLELWRPEALWVAEQGRIQLHTTLTAVAALLGMTALALGTALSSLALVFYAGAVLSTAVHFMAMNGLDMMMLETHLFPGNDNPFVWRAVSGVFDAAFLLAALPLRRHARWAIPVLGALALLGVAVVVALYPFLDGYARPFVLLRPSGLTLMILAVGIAAALQCRLAGHRPATWVVVGWLVLAAGNLMAALRNAGVLPWTEATYFLPTYAPLAEMLCFGIMAVVVLRAERTRVQRVMVTALRRNEAELAERVTQRTTALAKANAALRDRESQLRRILEAAPFPILLFHADSAATLYANHRARALFSGNTTLPARLGRDLHQDPADHDRLLALLERNGSAENVEMAMRDAAGNPVWVLASLVAIDYQGLPARLLAVNDISRRRQLEQELTKAREVAEAALGLERASSETQRQFLAMISHEFRTPLSVIAVAVQSLGLAVEDETVQARLARVERAVRYMNGMIDACLLDDRFEGAGLVLRTGALDLTGLVRDTADAAQAASPGHAVRIRAETLPGMTGDAPLLGIALSNLVENAVKYSPRQGAVDVVLLRDGGEAVVTVADQGKGVPEDERERIFEKYYRCAGTGRVPGAGLGLYLARRIVAAHGGTVGVRNRPDGGALFTLRLPLEPAPALGQNGAPADDGPAD
ncbi:sensor histidine kinase [Azospirillum doebereinerae]|nr:sensor histidine kinase [Azospirillum doebereinerae]